MDNFFQKIDFFICPHGFGHIRRVLRVVEIILNNHDSIQIRMHVNKEHLASFQELLPQWHSMDTGLGRIQWITTTMSECPDFSRQGYNMKIYDQWVFIIKDWLENNESSLVVSDNLVTPAFYGKRTLLMGSFLWSSVITDKYLADYQLFVKRELLLLSQRKLRMLALEDMAMPDIHKLTQIVPLPWFCNKKMVPLIKEGGKYKVLLSVGGTSKWLEKGLELLDELEKNQEIEWYLDRGLYQALVHKTEHIQIFDFRSESFAALDLVVARPGIGILTDCIEFNIPIVAIGEDSNAEMVHNARVVSEKDWGWNLLGEDTVKIIQVFDQIFKDQSMKKAKTNLEQTVCGGSKKAADYMLSQLN